MDEQTVVSEKVGKTALVTLNRPTKTNALDHAVRDALPAAIAAARDDSSVRSVVLMGAGGDFCSGADLGADIDGGEKAFASREVVRDFHRWFDKILDLGKPVIAAVDGVAAGADLSRAKGIVFSAREIGADEARALGLAYAVVPAESLRDAALEYVKRYDDAQMRALGLAKSILNRAFETDRQAMALLEAAAQSDVCNERVSRGNGAEVPRRELDDE